MFRLCIALAAAVLAGTAHAQVEVKDPWVRGMVETQKATGAFMRLTSRSAARLVGVSSPVAGVAEIHQTKMEGGVARMRPVAGIDLPAGQAVELKPGGYHVMLMRVKSPVKEGDTVPLTLVIESAGGKRESVTVQAPVRALATPAHGHMKH
jgi:copper(I)-binding protein